MKLLRWNSGQHFADSHGGLDQSLRARVEGRAVKLAEQRIHAPVPAVLARLCLGNLTHLAAVAFQTDRMFEAIAPELSTGQPTDCIRYTIDHGSGGDADNRQSGSLRFHDRHAEGLVRHRRHVNIGAREPTRELRRSRRSRCMDPRIIKGTDFLAEGSLSEQHEARPQAFGQLAKASATMCGFFSASSRPT